MEAKLQAVKQTLRSRMHGTVPEVGKWLGRVLNGFYQYHGVPGNWTSLARFRSRLVSYWRRTLERRSQRGRLKADQWARLARTWLPLPRLVHPYPETRFDARHPR